MKTIACGARLHGRQPVERPAQVGVVVDDAVVEAAASDEVRVAEVGDDVPRGGVLAELHHGEQPRTRTGVPGVPQYVSARAGSDR